MEVLAETVLRWPVVDLLALAWLLTGGLLGLLRGLALVFAWLLWELFGLWLARTVAPVILSWLTNTKGADRPEALLAAYGALAALALGLPLLGRALSGPGGPKRAPPGQGERGLAVVAGLGCALFSLVLLLPYAGRWPLLGAAFPAAVAPRSAQAVAERLSWLYPPEHSAALARLVEPPPAEESNGAAPLSEQRVNER